MGTGDLAGEAQFDGFKVDDPGVVLMGRYTHRPDVYQGINNSLYAVIWFLF